MQHLYSQVEEKQARKWNFDQKWGNIQRAVTQQNQERFQDIQASKNNACKKIQLITQLQNNKISLINQQANYLNSQEDSLLKNIGQNNQNQKQYQEQYQQKNIDFINDYLQNSQNFNLSIMEYAKNKVKDVSRKLQVVDQNIRRKTDQTMKQIRDANINHIKEMMNSQKEKSANNLKQIQGLVGNSLRQMRESLKQYEKQCEKSQNKISNMMTNLSVEMQKLISDESKAGDITYDCLLKLVEDSCSKIQEIQLR